MHEVKPYLLTPPEGHNYTASWVREKVQDYHADSIASHALRWDTNIEEWYGKQRRIELELKPSLHYEEDMYVDIFGKVLLHTVFSLRLPPNTIFPFKHHNPSYWYVPEGNEQQATLMLGWEQHNTSGETNVHWQTARPVIPQELIFVPPQTIHALVNPEEKPFYGILVTRHMNIPKPYKLSLRERLTFFQS